MVLWPRTKFPSLVQVPVATNELHDSRTGGVGLSLIFLNSVGHQ